MPTFTITAHERADPELAARCERVLRALPEWFGMEAALLEYIEDIRDLPTWAATADDGQLLGFLGLRRHFPETAEIHILGVLPDRHRSGVGRALVEACEAHLRADGCRYLQVKTLGPSRQDANYERTRHFYLALGFVPLEEFLTLWSEGNPCLQMVKSLRS